MSLERENELIEQADDLVNKAWLAYGKSRAAEWAQALSVAYSTEAAAKVALAAELRVRREASTPYSTLLPRRNADGSYTSTQRIEVS